jgi:zinc transporter ZupT
MKWAVKFLISIYYIFLKSKAHSHSFSINWYSFVYGVIGFFSFLSIIIVAKYFNYIAGTDKTISIDTLDVFLAILGFLLVYLFKRLEKKENGD